ncbi:PTS sugar transporter subunit IIA [Candidatus Stoquefichus massiliensis]|uniref:PTS sugar transporter subunit IIA n=1 Tax=Candidatus Stoquefichus massiliensis TaxID=1470350 RepID=UPI000483E87A|nr:PTS glucose transporter subunit IIA [Candidatus Stoquefichus massiliensis]
MFQFLKKKTDFNLYAPIKGKCIDIAEVKDKVFASKVMGDGFAVIPDDNVICSPCEGVITMIFPSKHAFGIKMKDGKEILIHIGIDTVQLNGNGFVSFKQVNEHVKIGEPVIQFDKINIESQNYDLTTMVIVTNQSNSMKKQKLGEMVEVKDLIVSY